MRHSWRLSTQWTSMSVKTRHMFSTTVWKSIPGFSRYEVSSDGDVRNITFKQPRLLKLPHARKGQISVIQLISDTGVNTSISLGKLVLSTFDPRENTADLYAAHITGDVKNNRLDNLRWESRSQIGTRRFATKPAYSKKVIVTMYDDSILIEKKQFESIKKAREFINQIFVSKLISVQPLDKSEYLDKWLKRKCLVKYCDENEYSSVVENLPNEKWKQFICNTRNKYYVSDYGRIKRVGKSSGKEVLHSTFSVNGYTYVNIRFGCELRHFSVHMLVAEAFVPNPHNYKFLDHEDTCPSNNIATNLRWVENHRQNVNNPKSKAKN